MCVYEARKLVGVAALLRVDLVASSNDGVGNGSAGQQSAKANSNWSVTRAANGVGQLAGLRS